MGKESEPVLVQDELVVGVAIHDLVDVVLVLRPEANDTHVCEHFVRAVDTREESALVEVRDYHRCSREDVLAVGPTLFADLRALVGSGVHPTGFCVGVCSGMFLGGSRLGVRRILGVVVLVGGDFHTLADLVDVRERA